MTGPSSSQIILVLKNQSRLTKMREDRVGTDDIETFD